MAQDIQARQLHTIPTCLRNIASPPKQLFYVGSQLEKLLQQPRVAIVGSRKVTTYGQQVTTEIAFSLAKQGILIISGLALGIDGIAHRAALEAGGQTLAVLPCALDVIVPASHRPLAARLIKQGGGLISEYPPDSKPYKQNFVARNRLVAGLAQAVLVTEAAIDSGSLHTARFAEQQAKPVLAVPGNITSPGSAGTNNLLKAGARPVVSYHDVLEALGLTPRQTNLKEIKADSAEQQRIVELLLQGITQTEALLAASNLNTSQFNQLVAQLEVNGLIRALAPNRWTLC